MDKQRYKSLLFAQTITRKQVVLGQDGDAHDQAGIDKWLCGDLVAGLEVS
jgi:hypothetical protein